MENIPKLAGLLILAFKRNFKFPFLAFLLYKVTYIITQNSSAFPGQKFSSNEGFTKPWFTAYDVQTKTLDKLPKYFWAILKDCPLLRVWWKEWTYYQIGCHCVMMNLWPWKRWSFWDVFQIALLYPLALICGVVLIVVIEDLPQLFWRATCSDVMALLEEFSI